MPLIPTLNDPRFSDPFGSGVRAFLKRAPVVWWVALLVAEIVALRIRLASVAEPGDDAYITLRHVKNLLDGHGYVYNLGEPMLGTSTVLYPLLLTLVCLVTGKDPVSGGVPLALGCEMLNIPLLLCVATRLTGSYHSGAFVALVYAFSRYAALASMIHMEAPLFVLTILGTVTPPLLSNSRRARDISSLFAGLAALTRPEGVLVVVLLLGHRWITERRLPIRDLGFVLITTLPWLIFSIFYFGGPIPQSVRAKRVAYFAYPLQAALELTYHFSYLFIGGELRVGKTPYLPGLAVGLPLWLIGCVRTFKEGREAGVVLFGFNVLFLLAYLVANPFIFLWYVVPLEPAYLIGIVIGIRAIADVAVRSQKARTVGLSAGAVAALLVLPTRYNVYPPVLRALGIDVRGDDRPMLSYRHSFDGTLAGLRYEREGWYKQAADDLAPYVSSTTTILASEFGALGYFSKARLVSSVGHVSPEVVRYLPPLREETEYPAINHSIPVSMVKGLMPEYVVSLEIFIRRSLLKDPWFASEYRLWKKYPVTIFGSDGLYVFERNDLSTTGGEPVS